MGAVVALALVAPLVLDRPDTPHRLLGSTADGDAGALVLWPVHLAPGRAGHGVPGDRDVPVHRPDADGAGADADLRLRDRRRQLRAWSSHPPGKRCGAGRNAASPRTGAVIDAEADSIAP